MSDLISFEHINSPFAQLRALLKDKKPGKSSIDCSIGGPRHPFPDWVSEKLVSYTQDFGRYPPIKGQPFLTDAFETWLGKRFPSIKPHVNGSDHCLPLVGSREGLFYACFIAKNKKQLKDNKPPLVLIPNPFYQAYAGAAIAAGCQPYFLNTSNQTGHLPNLDEINEQIWMQTAAIYLCSPSNPQGAAASKPYLKTLVQKARTHNFFIFSDECYTDLYYETPPYSALEAAIDLAKDEKNQKNFKNVISFFSLSKRSSMPGLRSGFCAGDKAFQADFAAFRNVCGPTMAGPIQKISADLWLDEAHVEKNRLFYKEKFNLSEFLIESGLDYRKPDGGMFLWLNVKSLGGGEKAALKLWQDQGLKVLPGRYLSFIDHNDKSPGDKYIRIALVDDLKTTKQLLERLKAVT